MDLDAIIKIIEGIATSSPTANIVKGVIVILALIGWGIFKLWLHKQKVKKANENTEQRRQDNQTSTDQEAQDLNTDQRQSGGKVDDFLGD